MKTFHCTGCKIVDRFMILVLLFNASVVQIGNIATASYSTASVCLTDREKDIAVALYKSLGLTVYSTVLEAIFNNPGTYRVQVVLTEDA